MQCGATPTQSHATSKLPFPSFKNSRFQNEIKCKTFLLKMTFICLRIKHHFRINGFALNSTLKQRPVTTQKWSIVCLFFSYGRERGSIQVSGKLPTYPSLSQHYHFSLKAKCWLRGGVGGQFYRNLNLSEKGTLSIVVYLRLKV